MKSFCCPALLACLLQTVALAQATPPTAVERAAVPLLDSVPKEIVPGVYSLGELAPVFAYLIESDDGLVLIDTGYGGQIDRLASAIASLGFDPMDVSHVLVTHLHLDHWMNMDYIRSMTGARTYMGRADALVVERGAPVDVVIPARVAPSSLTVPPTAVDVLLEGDQSLDIAGLDLRAVDCAGHTPGSTCYFLESGPWRVLFGGDTVMSVRSGLGTYMTRLHPRLGGRIDAYRRTLARLAELPVNLVLPGHPYFDRRRTGRPPHPVVSEVGWRRILQEGLHELETVEARFLRDGRDFLDGTPRHLAAGLTYLGGTGDLEAAYAVWSAAGVCLVDPFRLPVGEVASALRRAGLRVEQLTDILLTRASPGVESALAELDSPRRLNLWGPEPAVEAVGRGRFRRHEVQDGAGLEACGHRFDVVSTAGWQPETLGYAAVVDGRMALFTGDAISPLTADDTLAFEQPEFARLGGLDELAALEALDVRLWLPGRPFAAQNANLYDSEWLRTVRINRLALASGRLNR